MDDRPTGDPDPAVPGARPRPPAFRGDGAFRDDRFDDVRDRVVYGVPLADEIAAAGDDRPLAGRSSRLGARVVDTLLYGASVIPGAFVLASEGVSMATPFGGGAGLSVMALGFVALLAYQAVLVDRRGQTLGKRLVGVRIVDLDDGSNPGFWRAFMVRGFFSWVLSAIPYVGTLYWVADRLLIFRDDRRCIHDLLARTVVVAESGSTA